MITEKDRQFMRYWEQCREKENTFISKLSRGLPMAIIFGLPILLLVIVVRIFFPDWYTKISQTTPGMFISAIIAVTGIVLFYAYFRMQYKWEMNQQLYEELKAKENSEK
jgi:glucan phosphoethanolaminetransferase (alkaline phosphatase superfamily)